MGYYLVYAFDDPDKNQDGPPLASGSGWLAWTEWALGFDGYEEVHCLAANGWDDNLDDLDTELSWLLAEEGDDDLKAITRTLQQAVQKRPDGCEVVAVTDGTPPADEGDEEPEEDES